jgi:hypothetical protein
MKKAEKRTKLNRKQLYYPYQMSNIKKIFDSRLCLLNTGHFGHVTGKFDLVRLPEKRERGNREKEDGGHLKKC